MMPHVHRRGRLSVPSCSVCDCGAISIRYPDEPDRQEWLETSWEPPLVPPPPRERPTTPLPLVRAEELARAGDYLWRESEGKFVDRSELTIEEAVDLDELEERCGLMAIGSSPSRA